MSLNIKAYLFVVAMSINELNDNFFFDTEFNNEFGFVLN